jgi:hypothetical protein
MSISLCEICGTRFRSLIKTIGSIELVACNQACEFELRLNALGVHYRNMLRRLNRTAAGEIYRPNIDAMLGQAQNQQDLRQVKKMIEAACVEEARIVDRTKRPE